MDISPILGEDVDLADNMLSPSGRVGTPFEVECESRDDGHVDDLDPASMLGAALPPALAPLVFSPLDIEDTSDWVERRSSRLSLPASRPVKRHSDEGSPMLPRHSMGSRLTQNLECDSLLQFEKLSLFDALFNERSLVSLDAF